MYLLVLSVLLAPPLCVHGLTSMLSVHSSLAFVTCVLCCASIKTHVSGFPAAVSPSSTMSHAKGVMHGAHRSRERYMAANTGQYDVYNEEAC